MSELTIALKNLEEERALFGHLDRNLRILRSAYDVDVYSRGGVLTLRGEPDRLEAAARCVNHALTLIRDDGVDAATVADVFRGEVVGTNEEGSTRTKVRPPAQPRSPNQKRYLKAIEESAVTFGLGPAGTGKTYLAVAMAVALVKSGDFRRIVLVRPAVEAGEHLGFLPGDLEAKIKPYLRPLYDALEDLVPRATLKRWMDEGIVEISPLAYMRGRTLNHAVIILDEAQNTTVAQMKMFLTRMGKESRIIVTGDTSQIDLPGGAQSGLVHAVRVLQKVEGVAFCHLSKADIVRHEVVQRIVSAYNRHDELSRAPRPDGGQGAAESARRTRRSKKERR